MLLDSHVCVANYGFTLSLHRVGEDGIGIHTLDNHKIFFYSAGDAGEVSSLVAVGNTVGRRNQGEHDVTSLFLCGMKVNFRILLVDRVGGFSQPYIFLFWSR